MDLEERALKRDKRFLVRLALGLLAGIAVGIFLYAQITSTSIGSCAASTFGRATGTDGSASPAQRTAP